MYRRRRFAVGSVALLALLGAYCAIVAAAPLPALKANHEPGIEASSEFVADTALTQAAADAQALPTAVGWLHDEQIWSNDEGTHRIASITKLITVLVGLEAAPVEAGTDGPSYTLTEADAALVDEVLAQDGTFAPAPVGLTLTTRQILDLTLVPSANNYAISYARWVFGSDEAFLAAAHDWLARNGLATVHIQEAAGLSDNNVASTADIVRLARIALSNPLVAEIVSQSQIEIAGLGEITTTNRLLGDPGVVGVKTGTTFPEGYSLVAAKHEIFGERDLIAIAVTMDRPDGDARAGDTRAALAAMATTGQQVQLAEQGARIGTAVTWTGAKVPLLVAADLATVLVPPETASRSIELSQVAIGPKGTKVGEIQATMPTGEQTIEIITGAKIEEPGFGWRFTHPGELLGL